MIGTDDRGGRAVFLDADSFDVRYRLRRDDLHSTALSDDGRTLAVGGEDGTVTLIDLPTGTEHTLDDRHDGIVQGVAFSPDGSTLVTTGDDLAVNVWDLATGSLRETLHGHAGRVHGGPVFDEEGSTAYTVGLDGKVIAWDLDGERRIGRAVSVGEGERLDVAAATFPLTAVAPASGTIVATTRSDETVAGVDPATGRVLWEADPWSDAQVDRFRAEDPAFAEAIGGWVTEMAVDPAGDVLAVAGQNPVVVLYDSVSGRELGRWRASRVGWVNGVSFSPDGSLVTSGDDGRVVFWDPSTQRPRREYRFFDEPADMSQWIGAPLRAVVSPDGVRLAVTIVHDGAPMEVRCSIVRAGSGYGRGRVTNTSPSRPGRRTPAPSRWADGRTGR